MNSSISASSNARGTTIAIISFAYFVIAVIALNWLNPSYGLAVSIFGGYDLGSYEFLIASTFFALGIGSLALGVELAEALVPSLRSWLGLLLLGLWGVGIFVAGIFPANEGGSTVSHMTTVFMAGLFPVEVEAHPETQYGFIHLFTILGSFFILALASILLSWKLKQYEKWRSFPSISMLLALLMLALAVFFMITLRYPFLLGYTTFDPGFFVVIGFQLGTLWLIITTVWLRFAVNGSVLTATPRSHPKSP